MLRMYSVRPGQRRFRPVYHRAPTAMSAAVALVAGGCLAFGLSWLGELRSGWFALAAYAALCALLGVFSLPWAAPWVAGAAWAFHNGFAEHRYGALGWAGAGPEAARFAVFAAAALVTSLPGALPRRRIRVKRLSVPGRS